MAERAVSAAAATVNPATSGVVCAAGRALSRALRGPGARGKRAARRTHHRRGGEAPHAAGAEARRAQRRAGASARRNKHAANRLGASASVWSHCRTTYGRRARPRSPRGGRAMLVTKGPAVYLPAAGGARLTRVAASRPVLHRRLHAALPNRLCCLCHGVAVSTRPAAGVRQRAAGAMRACRDASSSPQRAADARTAAACALAAAFQNDAAAKQRCVPAPRAARCAVPRRGARVVAQH